MTLLGIDIGGTGIKGAPVDIKTGQLVAERLRLPTPHPANPHDVADVVAEIVRHFSCSGPVGVTFPGVVKQGVIYTAANVDPSWVGANASEIFSQRTNGPVAVVNDADAAGIAEMRFGAGRDHKGVVILVTLGTGIGTAIFHDGRLIPNTEFGHLKIRGRDAEKRASEKVREDHELSWKQWSKRLAEFLGELEHLFSPDLFIIGGGISKKAEKFLPFLTPKIEVPIVPAEMRNEAGIVGAAYFASLAKA